MTTSHDHTIRTAAAIGISGATLMAATAAVIQLIVQTSTNISDDMWSYPLSSSALVPRSIYYAAIHVLVILGIVGVRNSAMAGPTEQSGRSRPDDRDRRDRHRHDLPPATRPRPVRRSRHLRAGHPARHLRALHPTLRHRHRVQLTSFMRFRASSRPSTGVHPGPASRCQGTVRRQRHGQWTRGDDQDAPGDAGV